MRLFKKKRKKKKLWQQLSDAIHGNFTDESPNSELVRVFSELTDELKKQYEINKGVLVIRRRDTQRLAAISTWNNGSIRDGLIVSLPPDSSLFEKVAEDGQVYTEGFCQSFSGNFFERKLLLDDDSRSFVVQPLKSDGEVVGLLAYSSTQPTAFSMFEEGDVREATDKFASEVRTLIQKI